MLNDIILNNFNNQYGIVIHLPINRIIKDYSILNKTEIKFAQNDWSHVDFLVYSKLTKAPLVAIEVDGSFYHQEGSKQASRDIIKNSIFEKYGLPLLRFNTKENLNKVILFDKIKQYLD